MKLRLASLVVVFVITTCLLIPSSTTTVSSNEDVNENIDYWGEEEYETMKFRDRFLKLWKGDSTPANATYTKVVYHYTKTMYFKASSNATRSFHYMRKWKNYNAQLILKALDHTNEENNRFRMYVFFKDRSLEGEDGEPFDPLSVKHEMYEFGLPDSKSSYVLKHIRKASATPHEENIYVVVEKVNCTSCPYTLTLTIEASKVAGPVVSSLFAAALLLVVASIVAFTVSGVC